MNDREKLIALLKGNLPYHSNDVACWQDEHIGALADHLIANGVTIQRWIPVTEKLPEQFVSVLGYMTDAGNFPPVRECYVVGRAFFFPALGDVHPVSHWMPMPEPPIEEQNRAREENDG